METYIKLYRKLLDWKWYGDSNTKDVFLHCLLSANYQDTAWHNEIIPAGSFITSVEKLGLKLGLSRQQVRRAFFNLQTTNEITIKTTNRYTVINVQNWAKYQSDIVEVNQQKAQQQFDFSTNKQPTDNQQATTVKELKNLKKERIKELDNTFVVYANGDEQLLKTLLNFEIMRKQIKKEMFGESKKLLCNKLDKAKAQGLNPIDLLEESILNSWQSVVIKPSNGNFGKPQSRLQENKNDLKPGEKVHGRVL